MVVQILIDNNKIEESESIYSQTPIQSIAQLLSQHFFNKGDNVKYIYYTIRSNKKEEALNFAQQKNLLDVYCEYLENLNEEEKIIVAEYNEQKMNFLKAAQTYESCSMYRDSI